METRRGIHTTEFYVTVVANVLGAIVALTSAIHISDTRVLTLLAIINAAYVIARGLAKQGVPA